MADPHAQLALLRFSGELGIKGRATRRQFRERLVGNLKDALRSRDIEARIEVSHDRILVELPPEHQTGAGGEPSAEQVLTRIFGTQSISWVRRYPLGALEELVETGLSLFREQVRGQRFAVRARWVGGRPLGGMRSHDVEVELGAALLPFAAGVDLGEPEVCVRLELAAGSVCFFSEQLPGPGGLPLGVEGAAVSLLSGGFDSAVASWQLLRRGVALDYVFCNLGGPGHLSEVLRVAQYLARHWSYGDRPRLHALDFGPLVRALREHTTQRYWQVLLKRMMLRAAARVGRRNRSPAIVTGDAMGQVSSQTLTNLTTISGATEHSLLRPLLGCDKQEIIEMARRIGSYELSLGVEEHCALVSQRPATAASPEAIASEEARLPAGLIEQAVRARHVFDLRSFEIDSLEEGDLGIDHLPRNALLIDLRPIEQFRQAHHPRALHLDFEQTLQASASLDRSRRYVFCCQFGLLSAHLAQQLTRAGFDAHHLRGGQPALMELAKSEPTRVRG
ncbi:MAG: tRNA 4-thiouridine(8) synthase ThiI [Myxococcales bacterium]|nr:tRNA 4-thiouridine(8) synthase ThiI [Myxococcales bacterium]